MPSGVAAAATARALEAVPEQVFLEQAKAHPEPAPAPAPPLKITYQPSLFREGVGAPKLIPIPTLTPLRPETREAPSVRRVPARSIAKPRRAVDSQQALKFPDLESDAVRTTSSETIFCEAPVALPAHRIIAALVDLAWILIGVGIFALTTFWGASIIGADLVIDKHTAPFLVAVSVVIAGFYRSIWYFANDDTPGMSFAGLQLVDFDGRRPDREQRGLRQIASLLSLAAAGLGLVWALVDEESLTWHDHISKTFPTAS